MREMGLGANMDFSDRRRRGEGHSPNRHTERRALDRGVCALSVAGAVGVLVPREPTPRSSKGAAS